MGIAETIDNILFAATTGLFKAYGLQLTEAPTPGEAVPAPLCAVIGFTGPSLTGALMIAADQQPIVATRPTPQTTDRDWVAELANQLLGRVKNRLLTFGVEIYATTPIVLRGERITPLGSTGSLPGVVFRTPSGGRITVWVDHHVLDGQRLAKLAVADESVAREGDVILF